MNFAHGELYMFGAYAGHRRDRADQLVLGRPRRGAARSSASVGALTEVATLRPLYRREPLYGLIMTFGLALVFREGARQIFGGDMRRILPPIEGSIPLLGMTYPKYRLFLLAISSLLLLGIWLFFTRTRAGIVVRAAVQDAEMLDGLGVNVPRVFTLTFAGSAALAAAGRPAARAGVHRVSADGRRDDPARLHRRDPGRHGLAGRLGGRRRS